jgi:hypothetical protein
MAIQHKFFRVTGCLGRFAPLALVFVGLVGTVNAEDLYQSITPFTITTTKELGAGGQHSAFVDGFSALWANPAALYLVQEGSSLDLGLGANGDLPGFSSQLTGIFDGSGINEKDMEKYAGYNLRNAPPLFSIRGPVAWGSVEKGFGIGFFNKFFVDSIINYEKSDNGRDNALFRSNLNIDLVLNAAHAFSLFEKETQKLFWGAGLKVFFRSALNLSSQTREVNFNAGRNYNKLDSAEKSIFGTGLNVGMFYMVNEKLSFGATVDDLFSGGFINRAEKADGAAGGSLFLFYPKFNFGAALVVKNTENFCWTLMADLRDIFGIAGIFTDEQITMLIGLSLGTELLFYKKFHLSFGMADMLPSAGLAYNFKKCTLSFALYGKNYDRANGNYAVFGFDAGIKIDL